MGKPKIPLEIQEQANKIVADFNKKAFKGNLSLKYYAVYKGNFLYLNRKEGDLDGPVARLKYSGNFNKWEFAIFKWSSERYDPDEDFFPGSQNLNGTIEGALKACQEAYPPSFVPSQKEMLDIFKLFLGN